MSILLLLVILVLFLIATVLTLYAFRQEEEKIKKYEEQGVTVEDELKRSHEYEATSFRKHLPLQIWMYIITIIVTFLLVGYFLV